MSTVLALLGLVSIVFGAFLAGLTTGFVTAGVFTVAVAVAVSIADQGE